MAVPVLHTVGYMGTNLNLKMRFIYFVCKHRPWPDPPVRGQAGNDIVSIFYEKVTALTEDQPPVVMVNKLWLLFYWDTHTCWLMLRNIQTHKVELRLFEGFDWTVNLTAVRLLVRVNDSDPTRRSGGCFGSFYLDPNVSVTWSAFQLQKLLQCSNICTLSWLCPVSS